MKEHKVRKLLTWFMTSVMFLSCFCLPGSALAQTAAIGFGLVKAIKMLLTPPQA